MHQLAVMEAPAKIRAIAFDKTGTLTEGRPRVSQVVPLDGHSEEELLQIAAALEAHSNHPLARAIVEHAKESSVAVGEAVGFQISAGQGSGRPAVMDAYSGSDRTPISRSVGRRPRRCTLEPSNCRAPAPRWWQSATRLTSAG